MWILSEYTGNNYGIINLNYVSRIYMEYETDNGESNRLLADYNGEIICLGEYETEEELQEKVQQLGYEMARTGIGITLNISKKQVENKIEVEPIETTIDLEKVFKNLTPENKMLVAKSLFSLMTDKDLESLIELIQSQISEGESK